jgi:hypothetical protein
MRAQRRRSAKQKSERSFTRRFNHDWSGGIGRRSNATAEDVQAAQFWN